MNYTIEVNPAASLGPGLTLSFDTIYPIFDRMRWVVRRAIGSDRFITCDSPVSWVEPTPRRAAYAGHGLAMRHVEVTFPVSPALCFLGTWEGPTGVADAPDRLVAEFNRRRVGFADRYVFADQEPRVRAALELR